MRFGINLQYVPVFKEVVVFGVNINQITHYFHNADTNNTKMFYTLKVGESYREVGETVNVLVEMVARLGEKWLQR